MNSVMLGSVKNQMQQSSFPRSNSGRIVPLAVLTSATHVVRSSLPYSWKRLVVEEHLMPAGERAGATLDRHMLVLHRKMVQIEFSGDKTDNLSRSKLQGRVNYLPGRITLTPFGTLLPARQCSTSSEIMVCALDPNFVQEVMSREDDLAQRVPSEPRLNLMDSATTKLIELLMEKLGTGSTSGELYVESLTYALTLRFLLLCSDRLAGRETAHVLPQIRLKRVLKHIEDGLASDLSLSSLAQEVGYSSGHFLRMFRNSMGVTPYQYLIRCRIDRARNLLHRGNLSLCQIALSCGFASQSHLTQMFREHVGTTPGHYRRNC